MVRLFARVPESTLREWLAFALAACDTADEIALRHFRRDLDLERKPDRTFVTVADQGIERVIRERIRSRYPDHGLVGEEYGTEDGAGAGPAGTSTPSTAPTTSSAACRCSAPCWASSTTVSCRWA